MKKAKSEYERLMRLKRDLEKLNELDNIKSQVNTIINKLPKFKNNQEKIRYKTKLGYVDIDSGYILYYGFHKINIRDYERLLFIDIGKKVVKALYEVIK